MTYQGAGGDDIQMWVVYPPGFDPAQKYPLYLLLHGGPHNGVADAWTFRWNAQVFAAWGYVVAWHNFHGSSGFGQAFTDSINPDHITKPYQDTIKAAEWFAAQPWIDRDRLTAGGGSYGGFLAATLNGKPHPFKALVAHAAVYSEYAQYGADYGAGKRRFFEAWERPEEFARYSPNSYAEQLRDADAGRRRGARPARAAQQRHRILQHPAEPRRREPTRVFPRREPLGAEAAELAVLVPGSPRLARPLRAGRRPLKPRRTGP